MYITRYTAQPSRPLYQGWAQGANKWLLFGDLNKIEMITNGTYTTTLSYAPDRQRWRSVDTKACLPLRADVFRFLKSCRQQFDMVFADPIKCLCGYKN